MHKEPTNKTTPAEYKDIKPQVERGAKLLAEGKFSKEEKEQTLTAQVNNLVNYIFNPQTGYIRGASVRETYEGVDLNILARALLHYIGKRHALLMHQTLGVKQIQKYYRNGFIQDPSSTKDQSLDYFEAEFSSWHEVTHYLVAYLSRKGEEENFDTPSSNGVAPAYYEQDRNKLSVLSVYGGSQSLFEEYLTTIIGPSAGYERLNKPSLYLDMAKKPNGKFVDKVALFLDGYTNMLKENLEHTTKEKSRVDHGSGEDMIGSQNNKYQDAISEYNSWRNFADAVLEKITDPGYTPTPKSSRPLEDLFIELALASHNRWLDGGSTWFSVLAKYYKPLFDKALAQWQIKPKQEKAS